MIDTYYNVHFEYMLETKSSILGTLYFKALYLMQKYAQLSIFALNIFEDYLKF